MKNKRTVKLLVTALSLVILVGSLIGIAVSAETDGTQSDIIAANIVYGDRVQLAFAVDTEVANAENTKLYYHIGTPVQGAEPKTATLLEGETYTENGVRYPIYVTEGIPVKDIGDKVYAFAASADAELPADPDYTVYSVAEYLYARLYKDGYIEMTVYDGKEYNRKRLYELLLEYAAQAQTVLVNDVSTGATETLVTDYVYVAVRGGNIGDSGAKSALYEGPTEINLTAPIGAEGAWQLTTYTAGIASTVTLSSPTVRVTEPCVITFGTGLEQPADPSLGVAKPEAPVRAQIADFDGSYDEEEKALSYSDGTKSTVTELIFADGSKVNYGGSTNTHGAVAKVVDGYLNMSAPKRVHDRDRAHDLTTTLSYTATDYTAYVYEVDIMVPSTLGSVAAYSGAQFMFRPVEGSGLYLQYNMVANSSGMLIMGGVAIASCDEWFTLRLEFLPANNEIRAYVKNDLGYYEYRGSLGAPNGGSGTKDLAAIENKVGYVSLGALGSKSYAANVSVDNVMLYAAKIDYSFEEIVIAPKTE